MKFSFFGNRSIRQKLLISCTVITLIPLIIVEIVFGYRIRETEYKRRIESANLLADKTIGYFTLEMEKAEVIADNLANFLPLDKYLNTEYHSRQVQYDHYVTNIKPMLTGFNDSQGSLVIRVYHNRDIPVFSEELPNTLNEITRTYFDENPFTNNVTAFWKHVKNCSFDPMLSYFRVIRDDRYYYTVDYVVSVHLQESKFYSYLENEPVEESRIILFDDEGRVLTSNDRTLVNRTLKDLDCSAESMEDLFSGTEVKLDGKTYYFTGRRDGILSLAVLLSKDALRADYLQTVWLLLLLGAFLLGVSSLLVSYSTSEITKGIRELMEKMGTVTRSSIRDMAKDETKRNSQDEIVQLDSAFTKMMGRIDTLVDTVRDDEAKLKDEIIGRQQAELSYLQQQINPHYLFNTLEAFRMNLYLKNDLETASMIKMFAESFRRYINIQDKLTTLFEETAFIEKYIAIQNYRLGNKISFKLVAKERDLSTEILKLLIQPIVENSVTHGLEEKEEGGSIVLIIKKTADTLTIQVTDDGVGFSEEDLRKVRKNIYGNEQTGSVALRNVYRRIKLYYGEKADLTIESVQGEGSTVTMTLPLRKEEKDVPGTDR